MWGCSISTISDHRDLSARKTPELLQPEFGSSLAGAAGKQAASVCTERCHCQRSGAGLGALCSSGSSLCAPRRLQTAGLRLHGQDRQGLRELPAHEHNKKEFCRLHTGPCAEGEHRNPQNTQWAIFLLLNISLLGWEISVIPNTPCTFFCAKCLGRSQQFSHPAPSLQGPSFPEQPL